jgi:hypothetical protein
MGMGMHKEREEIWDTYQSLCGTLRLLASAPGAGIGAVGGREKRRHSSNGEGSIVGCYRSHDSHSWYGLSNWSTH